jgi:BCD family chlorophyll transporter-like MFS transporter
LTPNDTPRTEFREAWLAFNTTGRTRRRLIATALGTAGFSMQDVLLEPYGGKILHLPVGATTALTAMLATGGGFGLYLAARWLTRGADAHRVAAIGAILGVVAFAAVIFSAPIGLHQLFIVGVGLIGMGGGLFAHGTLTASMGLARPEDRGLALGAWGAAQATAAGLAIGFSGVVCDIGSSLAVQGAFGATLADPATGYAIVYAIEILLLFATLVAIGPLVRVANVHTGAEPTGFDLVTTPGLHSGVLR